MLKRLRYSVFYTNPFNTLRRGDIYFLGFNPGGDSAGQEDFCDPYDFSSYTKKKYDYCAYIDEEFPSALQGNVKVFLEFVLKELKNEPDISHIFSSNLYFFRSPKSESLLWYGKENYDCWQYHENFLKIVGPKVILCMGNSERLPVSTFRNVLHNLGVDTPNLRSKISWPYLYASFYLKWVYVRTPWKEKVLVLGLPHMSRFSPNYDGTPESGSGSVFWHKMKEILSQINNV